MKHKPTAEQQAILDAFPKQKTLKVNAVAGSGKTSTLQMLAAECNAPSLYVCFNKANALEASEKFPQHVACRTIHSLAFSAFGRNLMHKLNSPFVAGAAYVNKGRSNKELVKLYGIPDLRTSEDTVISDRATARLVKLTVGRFQMSAAPAITTWHIPKYELNEVVSKHEYMQNPDALAKYRQVILNFAEKLWADRIDPNSPVQCEHDTYLKLFQLSEPKLPYEVIYVDESQDTNPVAFDIFKKQTHAKMVYVGDTYQSIYGFRMAVNAMDEIQGETFVLSKSFRYGQRIADVATSIIRGAIDVKGLETIDSKIIKNPMAKRTIIFRTNGALMEHAVDLIRYGVKVYANIDTRAFENQLNSVLAIYEGRLHDVKDDELALYSNWDELAEAAEDKVEYKRLMQIVENDLALLYLRSVKDVQKNKMSYDILLTTAHKSKGMEWQNVEIADDFPSNIIFAAEDDPTFDQQEVNLFYVACTRAINTLRLAPDVDCILFGEDSAFKVDVKMAHIGAGSSRSEVDRLFKLLQHKTDLPTMCDMLNEQGAQRLPNGSLVFVDEDFGNDLVQAAYGG